MADDENQTFDQPRRFEIYVPKPGSRINLGAANLTDSDEGPFGYDGVSIQSGDANLYIDSALYTLFQTGFDYLGQSGASWSQYADGDMTLSATACVNLSADRKIVIASGAGMGPITAKDHGRTMRLVPYNNLELHYQVDAIQTGLFEFFHGRRKHDERMGLAKFGGVTDPYFDAGSKAATELAKADFKGGFLVQSTKSLRELMAAGGARPLGDLGKRGADLDPIFHLDGILLKGIASEDPAASSLEYGFSDAFGELDPYGLIDTSEIKQLIVKGIAKFKNAIVILRRFADVALKYANLITDNALVKRAVAAMETVNKLVTATGYAYSLTNDVLGYWIGDGEADPDAGGRDMPFVGKFRDEFESGAKARIPDPQDLEDGVKAARASVKGAKAAITSKDGPFDLGARSPTDELVIEIEHPSQRHVVTLDEIAAAAAEGTPATLSVTAALDAAAPALRVRLETERTRARGVSAAELAAWASSKLGAPIDATAAASSAGFLARPAGRTVRAHLRNERALLDSRKTFDVYGSKVSLQFRDVVTLERVEQTRAVVIAIDGTTVRVPIDSGRVDQQTDAQGRSDLREQFEVAIGTVADVGPLARGAFALETHRVGAVASIWVADGDDGALGPLGLTKGTVVNGTDPAASAPVTALRAAQLLPLVSGLEGLEAEVDGEALVLRSSAEAEAGNDSKITVSGALADALFTKKTMTETISAAKRGAADRRAIDTAYNELSGWNTNLQILPEDTQNLVRPVREAIHDVLDTMSSLDQAVDSATEVVSGSLTKALPSGEKRIGLIANDGITLGTQDRIVGAGGKGIVFIADGGSGTEDHDKFIPAMETFVNAALQWDPIDKFFDKHVKGPDDPDEDKPPSLGFRVYSDSTVDLLGTYAAQLMALGRGEVKSATADGKTKIGIGIARIAGSHAVDIAGYRRVVVGARNAGTADDDGGRLDLLGQTIFLGGFNEGGAMKDFEHTAGKGAGLEALSLASIAGHEHLSDDELTALQKDVAEYGWSKELRDDHPHTNFVRIHAAKETTLVVGGFMLHASAADGLALGTRKKDEDPSKNALDLDKAHLTIGPDAILLQQKKDKAALELTAAAVELRLGKNLPALVMDKAHVHLQNKDKQSLASVADQRVLLQHKSTKVVLQPSGVNMKGDDLTFNGQKVKIG
ncbi:MAG: hypothetical protein KF729_05475 [Sandaracinaceae bacterium]|nr:hypothetical protein [Sandaracinaceae bacterium]